MGPDPASPRPVVRPAASDEAPLLAALHAASFVTPAGDREVWSPDVMGQLLRGPDNWALVAELDGRACGLALFRLAGDEAEILTLGVGADTRRRGCGRALMEAIFGLCAGKGVSRLFLEVAEDNQYARKLYEALGFARIGCRKAYYTRGHGSSADALVFFMDIKKFAISEVGSTCGPGAIGAENAKNSKEY